MIYIAHSLLMNFCHLPVFRYVQSTRISCFWTINFTYLGFWTFACKVSDCMFYEFYVPKNVELKNIEQESPPLMFSKMRKLTQQKLAVLRYEMLSKSVASFTGRRLVYFGYVNQYFLFSLRHF